MRKSMHYLFLFLLVLSCLCLQTNAVIVGIDFGSDSFKVVLVKSRSTDIVLNRESERKTINAFSYSPHGRVFESSVLQMMEKSPEQVYHHLNLAVGRRAEDLNATWIRELRQKYHMHWLNHAVLEPESDQLKRVGDRVKDQTLLLEELVAQILSKIRDYVMEETDALSIDCVIVVPTHWTCPQRQAILDAAVIAKVGVLSLINQNLALAIKYSTDLNIVSNTPYYALFYDFGESNLQVSLYQFQLGASSKNTKNLVPNLNILAHFGDELGGIDFDNRIIELLLRRLKGKVSDQLLQEPRTLSKLQIHARHAKEVLSANRFVQVSIDSLTPDFDFETLITRAEFEDAVKDLLDRAIAPIQSVLEKSNLTLDRIHAFEVFGASTRIPKLQEMLANSLAPVSPGRRLNTNEAAALGAALYGAMLSSQSRMREYNLERASFVSQPTQVNVSKDSSSAWEDLPRAADDSVYSKFTDAIKADACSQILPDLLRLSSASFTGEFWTFRGICEHRSGKIHDAISSFRIAVRLDPEYVMAWNNLGVVLDEIGNFTEAIQSFDTALTYQPTFLKSICNKANTLLHLNQSENAALLVNQAIETEPNSPIPWYVLTQIYLASNNTDMALRAISRALDLQPSHLAFKISQCQILARDEHSNAPECTDLLNATTILDFRGMSFALDELAIQSPPSALDGNHTALFAQGTFFNSKKTLKYQTTHNLLVQLSYPDATPLPHGIPRDLESYLVSWPPVDELAKSQRTIIGSTVKLIFEISRSGHLLLSKANAAVTYLDVFTQTSPPSDEAPDTPPPVNGTLAEDLSNPSATNDTQNVVPTNQPEEVHFYGVETVKLNVTKLGRLGLSPAKLKECQARLESLDHEDRVIRENDHIRSDLESMSYGVSELLEDDQFRKFSTEEERAVLSSKASEYIEMLESTEKTDKETFSVYRSDLSNLINIVKSRISEHVKFPKTVDECGIKLGASRIRLDEIIKVHDLTDDEISEASSLLNSTSELVKSSQQAISKKPLTEDYEMTSEELMRECNRIVSLIDKLNKRPKKKVNTEAPPNDSTAPEETNQKDEL
ncbi:uncharacterized protein LOC126330058 [Schistocerca gregaria]|uniref:uncharacterized protein LOC126330058 n=1 Tax=Schistocerca gregaria TaxID=7010 RepID=UPI00211EDC0A|nr:uncharacterized protein LOC126330058 [Schistocerca gregaria]